MAIRQHSARNAIRARERTVSRWIRAQKSNEKTPISAYLREAATRHPTAHVSMAVDTEDLIDPKRLHFALLGSQQFVGNDRLVAAMERYLSRLRGVCLTHFRQCLFTTSVFIR